MCRLDGRGAWGRMNTWIPSLPTWNYPSIVNRLHAVLCLVAQSCPTLCDPMDCSSPDSSVLKDSPGKRSPCTDPLDLFMGILSMKIMLFSRGPFQPRDQTQVSRMAGGFFTSWATREAQEYWSGQPIPSPGDLPNPGIKLGSPALQKDSLPAGLPGKP